MDIRIENKRLIKKTHIPWIAAGVFVFILLLWIIFGNHLSTLKVDRQMLTLSEAVQGQFNDYVQVNGTVQPLTTLQLSALESGIIEEKVLEEGAFVKRGDVIVRMSNSQLNIQILASEADLAEQENFLRNTMVTLEQQKLDLQRERNQLNLDVQRKGRTAQQYKRLFDEKLISREEYLVAQEDYDLAIQDRDLVIERQKQDSIYRSIQVKNLEESLESMRKNMELVRQKVENLNVKSPIDGQIGTLDVTLGQSVVYGEKIGQINDLSAYKIEALVDEHYIDRVRTGLNATFTRQDNTYSLTVNKVYPDVKDGQFKADFAFSGEMPDNLRTGQTHYISLELGQPTQAIIVPKGAFYQKTGGRWIYVVSPEGDKAYRREIRIGRQNPQYYEVLEGLEAGEKVIVSNYDTFGNNEMLILK